MIIRERLQDITEYVDSHRRECIIVVGAVLVVLFILIIVLALSGKKKVSKTERVPVPIERLYLPDEPGRLPDVAPSRVRKTKWTEEDFQQWFREPSEEDYKKMEQLYTDEMESLLERVP